MRPSDWLFSSLFFSLIDLHPEASPNSMKSIKRLLPRPSAHWVGDGFNVYPVFHDLAFSEELSPFLMLDYAAPKKFPSTKKKLGVGQHPHRGFETVTIAFQGEVEHGDSLGNRDVIREGDVQWMTAGRGIIHEEFHSRKFAESGGIFEMIQVFFCYLSPPASLLFSSLLPFILYFPRHDIILTRYIHTTCGFVLL
jgi:hypothetical protein